MARTRLFTPHMIAEGRGKRFFSRKKVFSQVEEDIRSCLLESDIFLHK